MNTSESKPNNQIEEKELYKEIGDLNYKIDIAFGEYEKLYERLKPLMNNPDNPAGQEGDMVVEKNEQLAEISQMIRDCSNKIDRYNSFINNIINKLSI